MTWHLIEGEAGCEFAVEHHCAAVVVDALRASATAAVLLDAGATDLLVVGDMADAYTLKETYPDALLFGERGGLPPERFDGGNSPRDVAGVSGRRVIFTTTTGSGRMVACWGAAAVLTGTTVNASAAVAAAASYGKDVVLIPAGLASDPDFDAQEDWAAAAAIASRTTGRIGEGADAFAHWKNRVEAEGLQRLFEAAAHAAKLRDVGLGDDVSFCAQMDLTDCVPCAVREIRLPRNRTGARVGVGCMRYALPA